MYVSVQAMQQVNYPGLTRHGMPSTSTSMSAAEVVVRPNCPVMVSRVPPRALPSWGETLWMSGWGGGGGGKAYIVSWYIYLQSKPVMDCVETSL